jgi:hypothetical protein
MHRVSLVQCVRAQSMHCRSLSEATVAVTANVPPVALLQCMLLLCAVLLGLSVWCFVCCSIVFAARVLGTVVPVAFCRSSREVRAQCCCCRFYCCRFLTRHIACKQQTLHSARELIWRLQLLYLSLNLPNAAAAAAAPAGASPGIAALRPLHIACVCPIIKSATNLRYPAAAAAGASPDIAAPGGLRPLHIACAGPINTFPKHPLPTGPILLLLLLQVPRQT